jgi:hypothetical protein
VARIGWPFFAAMFLSVLGGCGGRSSSPDPALVAKAHAVVQIYASCDGAYNQKSSGLNRHWAFVVGSDKRCSWSWGQPTARIAVAHAAIICKRTATQCWTFATDEGLALWVINFHQLGGFAQDFARPYDYGEDMGKAYIANPEQDLESENAAITAHAQAAREAQFATEIKKKEIAERALPQTGDLWFDCKGSETYFYYKSSPKEEPAEVVILLRPNRGQAYFYNLTNGTIPETTNTLTTDQDAYHISPNATISRHTGAYQAGAFMGGVNVEVGDLISFGTNAACQEISPPSALTQHPF